MEPRRTNQFSFIIRIKPTIYYCDTRIRVSEKQAENPTIAILTSSSIAKTYQVNQDLSTTKGKEVFAIIMSYLQALLLILGPIFVAFANAATPEQVAIGKVAGYTKGPLPHQSDFLTSTYCYCGLPGHVPGRKEEAAYFQFEYFNVHSDVTFILDHLCVASADDRITCLLPRKVDGKASGNNDRSEWQGKICRTWTRDLDIFKEDQFCFLPHENRYSRNDDFIKFNHQKRNLGAHGNQGPAAQPQEMVNDVCNEYCETFASMPYLNDSKLAPSHITIYEDMDDMCDSCR